MPLYEYKCQTCGDLIEVRQKFSDQPLSVHENCGGALERLISTSALQFKGSGWYVNDYGKGKTVAEPKPAAANGAAKTEKSGGASDTAPKTDTTASKPATTSTKTDS
jgi:putative FmdB family regulatory protein